MAHSQNSHNDEITAEKKKDFFFDGVFLHRGTAANSSSIVALKVMFSICVFLNAAGTAINTFFL